MDRFVRVVFLSLFASVLDNALSYDYSPLRDGELHDCNNRDAKGLHLNLTYTPTKPRMADTILITDGSVRGNVDPDPNKHEGFVSGSYQVYLAFHDDPDTKIFSYSDSVSCEDVLRLLPHGASSELLGISIKCPGLFLGYYKLSLRFFKDKMSTKLPDNKYYFLLGGHYYVRIRLIDQNDHDFICLHGYLNVYNSAGDILQDVGDSAGDILHDVGNSVGDFAQNVGDQVGDAIGDIFG